MRKCLIMLLATTMIFTITGCGNAQPIAETPAEPAAIEESVPEVQEEIATVQEEPVEEVVEVSEEFTEEVVEEPAPAPSYVEEKGLRVVDLEDSYTEVYTFTEFNKDDEGNPIADNSTIFDSSTTVTFDSVDNGDGTKTITYKCTFDIRDWSLEYNSYSSHTYLINTETGRIFSNTYGDNFVNVGGEDVQVIYEFEETYTEDYTEHTKNFSLTCPVEFEGYGMFFGDTTTISYQSVYETLDEVLALNEEATRTVVH